MSLQDFQMPSGQLSLWSGRQNAAGKPAVFMLHSSAASHRQWLDLGAVLEPKFSLFAPDFYGHGLSDRAPKQKSLTFLADVEAASLMLDEICVSSGRPAHIVGHSYGAAVALKLATLRPDKVASLALFEPVAFYLLAGTKQSRHLQTIKNLAGQFKALVAKGELDACADLFLRFWMGAPVWPNMPEHRRKTIRAALPAVADIWDILDEHTGALADLKNLSMPILLMGGEHTAAPAKALLEVLAAYRPKSRLYWFDGIGHMGPILDAPEVNQKIERFLNAVQTPAPAE